MGSGGKVMRAGIMNQRKRSDSMRRGDCGNVVLSDFDSPLSGCNGQDKASRTV